MNSNTKKNRQFLEAYGAYLHHCRRHRLAPRDAVPSKCDVRTTYMLRDSDGECFASVEVIDGKVVDDVDLRKYVGIHHDRARYHLKEAG